MSSLRYSKDHCWVRKSENGAVIGITDYVRKQICKSFEINLCDEGDEIRAGEIIGDIESCKLFDIISPVSGTVVRVNDSLLENKEELLDVSRECWLCELSQVTYTRPLMSEAEYNDCIEKIRD